MLRRVFIIATLNSTDNINHVVATQARLLKDMANTSLLTRFLELLLKNKSIIVADVEVFLVGLLISCFKTVHIHYCCEVFISIWDFVIKGATKLHFMYHSRVVIVLFSARLYKSAFSTYSFGKTSFSSFYVLVFRVPASLAFNF